MKFAYITQRSLNRVAVYDVATDLVVATIPVGNSPTAVTNNSNYAGFKYCYNLLPIRTIRKQNLSSESKLNGYSYKRIGDTNCYTF